MIRRNWIARLFAAAVVAVGVSAPAKAGLLPVSVSVQPEAGNFRWTYSVVLPTDMKLQSGSYFTIYDFGGYVGGSATLTSPFPDDSSLAHWSLTASNVGPTPDRLNPQDDPNTTNLTWTYNGPTIRARPADTRELLGRLDLPGQPEQFLHRDEPTFDRGDRQQHHRDDHASRPDFAAAAGRAGTGDAGSCRSRSAVHRRGPLGPSQEAVRAREVQNRKPAVPPRAFVLFPAAGLALDHRVRKTALQCGDFAQVEVVAGHDEMVERKVLRLDEIAPRHPARGRCSPSRASANESLPFAR